MDDLTDASLDHWVNERLSDDSIDREWRPDPHLAFIQYQRRQRDARKFRLRSVRTAAAAALALVVVLYIPGTNVFAKKCVAACVAGTARVSRFVLTKMPNTGGSRLLPALVREAAPDFTLLDQNGGAGSLSGLRGRVVLLNFWATWCRPCRTELPWFAEFDRRYRSEGLSIVGIALDDGGWAVVRPFVAQLKLAYPVMIGRDDVVSLYGGLASVPTTLMIDKAGRVAATHIGIQKKEDYEAELRALLAER
jgi:cytochrome c biogenesis protein CcmG/thiol:disulfide interchange protein DsbE